VTRGYPGYGEPSQIVPFLCWYFTIQLRDKEPIGQLNLTNRPLMKWLHCSRELLQFAYMWQLNIAFLKFFWYFVVLPIYLWRRKLTLKKWLARLSIKTLRDGTAGIYLKHCCTILSLFLTAGFYPPPSG